MPLHPMGRLLLLIAMLASAGCGARQRPLAVATEGNPDPAPSPVGDRPACTPASWIAGWPMPNPPSAGLPNPASYDTSRDGIVTDKVTGLIWQRRVSNE